MGRLWLEQHIEVWNDVPPAEIVEECKLTLVGKILSELSINLLAFQSTLRRFWKIDEVNISIREARLYVAKFKNDIDRQHVLDRGSWLFSGHLVIFTPWILNTLLHCYDFSTCAFWVQVFGIPLEWCSVNMVERAVKHIGKVLEVRIDSKEGVSLRTVRVRVDLDV
ncbi:uncharacterized protein [Rutidosis leptorrhynchoides]|uniref:uncharacterized protein n=1 Tax=Rutidosis leptorrhynchoides TaxID=125765 RepID=UPI003A99B158